jgi:aminoglycoside 6'-N-acetyltransferase
MITLRPARPSDRPLLEYWDTQPHVIAASDDDWGWEVELLRDPPWREFLLAELDGRPLGFLQLIDAAEEESHYWGDVPAGTWAIDIWIGEAADLGKGHGSVMMGLALDRCFRDHGAREVLIDPLASNTRAHAFYERQGFRFAEERVFGEDRCRVYRMDRATWETSRLP